MKWPIWFPYPSSWLRALLAILWISAFGYVVWMFAAWGWFLSVITGDLSIQILSLLLAFMVGACAYGKICDLLVFRVSKTQAKFVSWRGFWEGCLAIIVPVLSLINTVVAILPIYDPRIRDLSEEQAFILLPLLYLSAVFLYQLEYVLRHWFQAKRNQAKLTQQKQKKYQRSLRSKPLPKVVKNTPINSIEHDLNKLKGELGLTSMGDIRRSKSMPNSTKGSGTHRPR
ncbi:MAG: hypothetical protein HC795_01415 [Coleofasciculaceae cyanobacterium RL_1_1]|nr:hypothetical protein [Coleofasciculaceae cyanobacterium RL_1_1]